MSIYVIMTFVCGVIWMFVKLHNDEDEWRELNKKFKDK